MKTKKLKSGLVFFAILFTGSTAYSQKAEECKAKIEKINKEMAQAMVEGNSEKSLSFYTSDAISLPNNGQMLQGIEALRKSNDEMMKSGTKVTTFETNITKVIPCNDLCTEIGTYKITLTIPGMNEPVNDQGKYLTIWEKQKDGSLKVKVEIWNTDTNPMMHEKQAM